MYHRKNLVAFVFLIFFLVLFSLPLYADSVTTVVWFNIPTSTAFTVTLPGESGVSSGATADIEFNTTSSTINQLNASVAGTGQNQTSTTPIFNYTNTGNVNETITLQFNATISPTVGSITVKASNANAGYQSTCSGVVNSTTCQVVVNSTVNPTVTVAYINASVYGGQTYQTVWLWADFSNVVGNTRIARQITHTSSAS